jgi:2-succinyl-6-hydroxy-2,4-cyclohexadiene-1-carboxylate synthase
VTTVPSRRVVLAHGFTQTARSWDTLSGFLSQQLPDLDPVAVDMPGHGGAVDVRADLWQSADRLVDIGGPATYVGYSMGGRVALHAALGHPEAVQRLVLIGATAGIDDHTERADRRRADEKLADHIEQVGVETFIDEWLATPLFARLTRANDQRQDRLRNSAAGLASSLRSAGTGTQEPLWGDLGAVACPVLVVVGQEDEKFRTIGERLVSLVPRSEIVVIDGAGHSAHLEAPEATSEAIAHWIGGTASQQRRRS